MRYTKSACGTVEGLRRQRYPGTPSSDAHIDSSRGHFLLVCGHFLARPPPGFLPSSRCLEQCAVWMFDGHGCTYRETAEALPKFFIHGCDRVKFRETIVVLMDFVSAADPLMWIRSGVLSNKGMFILPGSVCSNWNSSPFEFGGAISCRFCWDYHKLFSSSELTHFFNF